MKILNEWIKKFGDALDRPGIIQAHEFLYLVANCKNRTELVLFFIFCMKFSEISSIQFLKLISIFPVIFLIKYLELINFKRNYFQFQKNRIN